MSLELNDQQRDILQALITDVLESNLPLSRTYEKILNQLLEKLSIKLKAE